MKTRMIRIIVKMSVVLLCCGCSRVNTNVQSTEVMEETSDTIQEEVDTAEVKFMSLVRTDQISPYDSLIVQKMARSDMYSEPTSGMEDYALLINYIYYNRNEAAGERIWSNLYDMFAKYPQKYYKLKEYANYMPDSCRNEITTQFVLTILYKFEQRKEGCVITDINRRILYDKFPFLKDVSEDLIDNYFAGRLGRPYFALNKVSEYKISGDTIRIRPDGDDHYLYYPFGEIDNMADFIKIFDKYNAKIEYKTEDADDPLNREDYAKITTPNSLTRVVYFYSDHEPKAVQIINSTITGDLVLDRGIQVGISKQQFIDRMKFDIDSDLLKAAKIIRLDSGLDGIWYFFIFDDDVLSKIEIKTDCIDSVQNF